MNREREIYRQVCVLGLISVCLFLIVLLAPNTDNARQGSFFRIAMSTSWRHPLDLAAAWCSFKVVLLSIGLFLIIESLGTVLSVRKRKSLALSVYFLQALPCIGFLFGGYYLLKSLL